MAERKIASKKFKTQKAAMEWAKKEKAKQSGSIKWETNRLSPGSPDKWEAVLYRNVK